MKRLLHLESGSRHAVITAMEPGFRTIFAAREGMVRVWFPHVTFLSVFECKRQFVPKYLQVAISKFKLKDISKWYRNMHFKNAVYCGNGGKQVGMCMSFANCRHILLDGAVKNVLSKFWQSKFGPSYPLLWGQRRSFLDWRFDIPPYVFDTSPYVAALNKFEFVNFEESLRQNDFDKFPKIIQ